VHYATAAGGFAHDSYFSWVAAEEVDVGLYPFESEALIIESCVGGAPLLLDGGTGEPTHCAEAVVHCYVNDSLTTTGVGCVDQAGWIVDAALLFGACYVAATIDPAHMLVLCREKEQKTCQTRTGAPPVPACLLRRLFALSKIFFGTTTSRKRQSSVS
jgi:hypothetical protein